MGIRLPPGFYLFEHQFTLYPAFRPLAFMGQPCLRRNARREHDCRCDYDSLHNRDAV